MSYVNPFASSGACEEKHFAEEKQYQPDKKKPFRRIKSAAESPHHDPVKKFQFFTGRRSTLSNLGTKLPSASTKKPSEGEHSKVEEIWDKMAGVKILEVPEAEPDKVSFLVTEFKMLWAYQSCRMKIKELAAAIHASENFNFLVCLERYRDLCGLKNEKKIIAEHNRIIEEYLSETAPSKIHLEHLPIAFMPFTNQAFVVDEMKERFCLVEIEIIRILAQNLMNNPAYLRLKSIHLETHKEN